MDNIILENRILEGRVLGSETPDKSAPLESIDELASEEETQEESIGDDDFYPYKIVEDTRKPSELIGMTRTRELDDRKLEGRKLGDRKLSGKLYQIAAITYLAVAAATSACSPGISLYDASVAREEALRQKLFTKVCIYADQNKDGVLSHEESVAAFKEMDWNYRQEDTISILKGGNVTNSAEFVNKRELHGSLKDLNAHWFMISEMKSYVRAHEKKQKE